MHNQKLKKTHNIPSYINKPFYQTKENYKRDILGLLNNHIRNDPSFYIAPYVANKPTTIWKLIYSNSLFNGINQRYCATER